MIFVTMFFIAVVFVWMPSTNIPRILSPETCGIGAPSLARATMFSAAAWLAAFRNRPGGGRIRI